jgi:hypothetical protein
MKRRHGWMAAMLAIVAVGVTAAQRNDNTAVLKGTAAFGGWAADKPGVRRLLTPRDLPAPLLEATTPSSPRQLRDQAMVAMLIGCGPIICVIVL